MKTLVIAEKPSAAQAIAQAIVGSFKKYDGYYESGSYLFTYAVGHLLELAEPQDYNDRFKKWKLEDLPILPSTFRLKPISKTYKQLKVIKELVQRPDVTLIVNGADSGREGQLIFDEMMYFLKVRKPMKRLWTSSLTPEAIQKSFQNMKENQSYESLFLSAKARAQSDWLIGMNATRALSVRHSKPGNVLSVGRVQTPLLCMVVQRQIEIENFKKEPFYEVIVEFDQESTRYKGTWQGDRLLDPNKAQQIAEKVKGKLGRITQYEAKPHKELPPKLYDLTTLQRECNRKFGFTASKTLSVAQKLYEEKKAITYPRTDSKFVDETNLIDMHKVFQMLKSTPYHSLIENGNPALVHTKNKNVRDASKVTDHHAILPTNKIPKNLTPDEQKVYDLIVRRFLCHFYPAAEYVRHQVFSEVEQETFKTNIKELKQLGWKVIYQGDEPKKKKKTEEDEEEQREEPFSIDPDQPVKCIKSGVMSKETQPPKPFTEDTLLRAMETCGKFITDEELQEQMKALQLGTPATRANMIETLKKRGYIELQGKNILPTEKGKTLIHLVQEAGVGVLTSPELTGKWEQYLDKIYKNQGTIDAFIQNTEKLAQMIVEQVRNQEKSESGSLDQSIAACPTGCGGQVVEGKKAFGCSRWKEGCKWTIWKQYSGKKLSARNIKDLLEKGKTSPLKFSDPNKQRVLLTDKLTGKLELEHADQETASTSDKDWGICPICRKSKLQDRASFIGCLDYPSCRFTLSKTYCQKDVPEEQIIKLIEHGRTERIDGFTSKKGRFFSAILHLKQGKIEWEFVK